MRAFDPLRDLHIYVKMVLKCILRKQGVRVWLDSSPSGWGLVLGIFLTNQVAINLAIKIILHGVNLGIIMWTVSIFVF
jgi:hypothetical protein